MSYRSHRIVVPRAARYYTLGERTGAVPSSQISVEAGKNVFLSIRFQTKQEIFQEIFSLGRVNGGDGLETFHNLEIVFPAWYR